MTSNGISITPSHPPTVQAGNMGGGGWGGGDCLTRISRGVLSEMESPGPRNSGSGDIGYGFVDFRGPGLEQSNNGLGPTPVGSAYGPSTEGVGTRVCGYVNKEE